MHRVCAVARTSRKKRVHGGSVCGVHGLPRVGERPCVGFCGGEKGVHVVGVPPPRHQPKGTGEPSRVLGRSESDRVNQVIAYSSLGIADDAEGERADAFDGRVLETNSSGTARVSQRGNPLRHVSA